VKRLNNALRLSVLPLGVLPLFARILVAFVLVVVPIYLTSFLLYQSGIQTIRERLLDAEAQQAREGLANLEHEIRRVQAVMIQFSSNYQLRKLGLESTINLGWDNVDSLRTLQENLLLLAGISPLVGASSVWLPHWGRSVTPWGLDLRAGSPWSRVPSLVELVDQTDGFTVNLAYPTNHETSGLQFVITTSFVGKRLVDSLRPLVRFPGGLAYLKAGAGGVLIGEGLTDEIRGLSLPGGTTPVVLQGRNFLATVQVSASFALSLVLLAPEGQLLGPLGYLSAWFAALTVLTLALGVLFALWLTASIEQPLKALMDGLSRVEAGDLKVALNTTRTDEIGFLYHQFDRMVASLDSTMTRLVEQETLIRQAELKQLQYQINPHFLYNSIYHMYRMARAEDFEGIGSYSLHLGAYFEFLTRGGGATNTLEAEAVHARNYMEIQRVRFGGRIRPEIAGPSAWAGGLPVPRLLLQPLLENAYNHGLADQVAGGVVRLIISDLDHSVEVTVEDNGTRLGEGTLDRLRTQLTLAPESPVSGLSNIHRRLVLQFGAGAGLCLTRSSLGGLAVTFRIAREEG